MKIFCLKNILKHTYLNLCIYIYICIYRFKLNDIKFGLIINRNIDIIR